MAVKNPRFQRFSAQALLWTLDAALRRSVQGVSPPTLRKGALVNPSSNWTDPHWLLEQLETMDLRLESRSLMRDSRWSPEAPELEDEEASEVEVAKPSKAQLAQTKSMARLASKKVLNMQFYCVSTKIWFSHNTFVS